MTESASARKETNDRIAQFCQALSYVALCGWLVWLWLNGEDSETLANQLDWIIFTDFFGYFLIFLCFARGDASVKWTWPLTMEEGGRIAGYLVIILIAGWFMESIAGWVVTLMWMAGLVFCLSDVQSLRSGAIVRILCALMSGFIVALTASFAGVPEESLLNDHVPTLFSWGLLYFGGVAVFRMIRLFGV